MGTPFIYGDTLLNYKIILFGPGLICRNLRWSFFSNSSTKAEEPNGRPVRSARCISPMRVSSSLDDKNPPQSPTKFLNGEVATNGLTPRPR